MVIMRKVKALETEKKYFWKYYICYSYTGGSIDIVSNGEGEMDKRYGQIYVDADNLGKGTFKRIKKDSFYWYKKAITSNGEKLD